MTTTEKTPTVPPVPRTFLIGLDETETVNLIAAIKPLLAGGYPAEIAENRVNFCNIRLAYGGTSPTASAEIQFLPR